MFTFSCEIADEDYATNLSNNRASLLHTLFFVSQFFLYIVNWRGAEKGKGLSLKTTQISSLVFSLILNVYCKVTRSCCQAVLNRNYSRSSKEQQLYPSCYLAERFALAISKTAVERSHHILCASVTINNRSVIRKSSEGNNWFQVLFHYARILYFFWCRKWSAGPISVCLHHVATESHVSTFIRKCYYICAKSMTAPRVNAFFAPINAKHDVGKVATTVFLAFATVNRAQPNSFCGVCSKNAPLEDWNATDLLQLRNNCAPTYWRPSKTATKVWNTKWFLIKPAAALQSV